MFHLLISETQVVDLSGETCFVILSTTRAHSPRTTRKRNEMQIYLSMNMHSKLIAISAKKSDYVFKFKKCNLYTWKLFFRVYVYFKKYKTTQQKQYNKNKYVRNKIIIYMLQSIPIASDTNTKTTYRYIDR